MRTQRVVCWIGLMVLAVASANAAELPQGFRLEPFVTGLTEPMDVDDTPDGLVLIAERSTGNVRVVRWGELQASPLCNVAVTTTNEGGLLGIAVHPDYQHNRFVYLYYTSSVSGKNKVTRFTVSDELTCTSPLDILADLGAGGAFRRNGGGIDFGPDGKLYVGVGDMEVAGNGQSLSTLKAKVLRLNDDGSIPSDNPTPGSAIYTRGVRDPRGLAVNAAGTIFTSDRGDITTHDEVNKPLPNGNLGWASESGTGGVLDQPLKSWLPGVTIHGVADYDGSLFPDVAGDAKDSDGDTYGPNLVAGAYRVDDNGLGECIGGVPNGNPCANNIECLPARTGELPPICDKLDEPAEYCPGGVAAGDDDCDANGAGGIDEPDESYLMDVFAAKSTGIERGAMMGGAAEVLSSWQTFFNSTGVAGCPTQYSGLMGGRDGWLYVLARNGGAAGAGALYRIVHEGPAGPREVSAPGSYVPVRVGKTANAGEVTLYWEDLRKDSMQVGDNGTAPTAPVRAYTVWRGQIGNWASHTAPGSPVLNGVEGTAVNDVVRSATVPVQASSHYFLVSGRGDNLEGTLGSGAAGEHPGFSVTDLCDTIGTYGPPFASNLFKCAPEVTLYDAHGKLRNLSEYRGRPVWIDFPAEWCGPCHSEANEMEEIYQLYKDRGVVVISMLMDEENQASDWDGRPTQAECRAWADRAGATPDHTFECWADPVSCTGNPCNANFSQHAWPKFNAFGALPTNLIVDQGGRVVWTEAGWSVEGILKNRLNVLVGSSDSCLH